MKTLNIQIRKLEFFMISYQWLINNVHLLSENLSRYNLPMLKSRFVLRLIIVIDSIKMDSKQQEAAALFNFNKYCLGKVKTISSFVQMRITILKKETSLRSWYMQKCNISFYHHYCIAFGLWNRKFWAFKYDQTGCDPCICAFRCIFKTKSDLTMLSYASNTKHVWYIMYPHDMFLEPYPFFSSQ